MNQPTATPPTAAKDQRALSELACDLVVVEHRLRDLRRWTPEAARAYLDAALSIVATALDALHAEYAHRTTRPTGSSRDRAGAEHRHGAHPPRCTSERAHRVAGRRREPCPGLHPGEDWVGAGQHRRPVLTLAQDDVIAIQGTPSELRALAARITAVATAASARLDLAAEAG